MENMWNEVKNKSVLRPLYVKEILFNYTDETHYVTIAEIKNILQSEYGVHAVRKTLYDDIDMLIYAGCKIEYIHGRNNTFMYHIAERDFDLTELRMLIDLIYSMRSLPRAKSVSIKKKLCMLAGPSADYLLKNTNSSNLPRTENNQIYSIIETLSKAITSNRQVVFKYSEHLTSSKKPLKRESLEYQVSPYRLVCYHNYYYLIAYSEKDLQTLAFKTDCICDIPEILLKDSISEPKGFSMESAACNN